MEAVVPGGEHLLGEIHRPVAGGLRPDQRSAPARPLAGERPGELVGKAFVLAEEEADLASADPDVPRRNVRVGADVALQLRHERLAKAHDLQVALAFRIEIRAALAAAQRQGGKGVLEHLLESEELENRSVDRRMKTEPSLVGPDRAAHLDPETAVHLDLAGVVHPGDPEHHQPLGLHHPVEDAGGAVLGMAFDDDGDGFDDFADRLVELGLGRVPRRHLIQYGFNVVHGPSSQFGRGL